MLGATRRLGIGWALLAALPLARAQSETPSAARAPDHVSESATARQQEPSAQSSVSQLGSATSGLVPRVGISHDVRPLLLRPTDPVLDGAGHSVCVDYTVDFSGTLYIWTSSSIDVRLQLHDLDGKLIKEDDNSGGGTRPCISLDTDSLKPNQQLVLTVAGVEPDAEGRVELHLVAARETEDTRAADRAARTALELIKQSAQARDFGGAMQQILSTLDDLSTVDGGHDSKLIVNASNSIGQQSALLGDNGPWLRTQTALLRYLERVLPDDHPSVSKARSNAAITLRELGDYSGSRDVLELVLHAYEHTLPEDHPDSLMTHRALANTLLRLGEVDGARIQIETALAHRHPDSSNGRLNILFDEGILGVALRDLGDVFGAEAMLERQAAGYERFFPPDDLNLAGAKAALAAVKLDVGDLASARALAESALAVQERILPPGNRHLFQTQVTLAAVLSEYRDWTSQRRLLDSMLADGRHTPARPIDIATGRVMLSENLIHNGEYKAALSELGQAIAMLSALCEPGDPVFGKARRASAVALRFMGDTVAARDIYRAMVLGPELGSAAAPNLAFTIRDLTLTSIECGDSEGAEAAAKTLLDQVHGNSLALCRRSVREVREGISLCSELIDCVLFMSEVRDAAFADRVFETIETQRMLVSDTPRPPIRSGSDDEFRNLRRTADLSRAGLNNLLADSGGGTPDAGGGSDELIRLSHERDVRERGSRAHMFDCGRIPVEIELSALRSAVSFDSAAVGFCCYQRLELDARAGLVESRGMHLLAHVVEHGGALQRVELGPVSTLEELLGAWRESLGVVRGVGGSAGPPSPRSIESEAALGHQLRQRILDPILAVLGDSITTLHVCPDDLLYLVPIDALPFSDGRVGDRLRIINQVSMAGLFDRVNASAEAPTLLVLGGVDYSGDTPLDTSPAFASSAPIELLQRGGLGHFAPLDGSRSEIDHIGALFSKSQGAVPTVLQGADASKARLRAAVAGKRYIHLATHGWFAPEIVQTVPATPSEPRLWNPMTLEERVVEFAPMTLCGLALHGANAGRDVLGRVPGLLTAEELAGFDLSDCELAVLSACETNVGIRRAGQGIQSLQAALHAAGAQSSITSLWKVSDTATVLLMERFYKHLWEDKCGKAEALWRAKTKLREAGYPVRDWAGWVLTGDPL